MNFYTNYTNNDRIDVSEGIDVIKQVHQKSAMFVTISTS